MDSNFTNHDVNSQNVPKGLRVMGFKYRKIETNIIEEENDPEDTEMYSFDKPTQYNKNEKKEIIYINKRKYQKGLS